jgi:hypothetical protein
VFSKPNPPRSETKYQLCGIWELVGFGVMFEQKSFRPERFWIAPNGGVVEHKAEQMID